MHGMGNFDRSCKHTKSQDHILLNTDENERSIGNMMKKESLLSLYGSMPPKGKETSKKWSDIRFQARKEMIDTSEYTNDEHGYFK